MAPATQFGPDVPHTPGAQQGQHQAMGSGAESKEDDEICKELIDSIGASFKAKYKEGSCGIYHRLRNHNKGLA